MTSHDVVARVRRLVSEKSVGHAGTLDPLASGVLIVLVGRATALANYAMASPKTYAAEIIFGAATDTDDAEGVTSRRAPIPQLTTKDVAARLAALTGEVMQKPPRYSAIKSGGVKAYSKARRGEDPELLPRKVTIRSIVVNCWAPPRLRVTVTTGPGAYIRSLARDAGELLDSAAYLHSLVRTASGRFTIRDSIELTMLTADNITDHLMAADVAASGLPAVFLSREETDKARHGARVGTRDPISGSEEGRVVRLYSSDGKFLGLGRLIDGQWQPIRVLEPAP